MLAYRVLKVWAIVGGFPAALICVMALIGVLNENLYGRLLGALATIISIPLIIADRLHPGHHPSQARGLITDVLAVSWLLTAVLIAAVGGPTTQPLLVREGDRLVQGGYPAIAQLAYLLVGVDTDLPVTEGPAPNSASAASATASAAAPLATARPEKTPSGS
jgi:hypothetical protein